MFKKNKTNYFVLSLKILLGIIFIFSGTSKLFDLNTFSEALFNFNLLNDELIYIVKYAIPIIEIVLGISIIFNFNSSLPAFISSLLLSLFTALIVVKLFEGEDISCGCFGALSSNKLDVLSVIRNVFLILISVIISNHFENKKNVRAELRLNKQNNLQFVKIVFISNIIFFLATQNLIFALQNNGLKSRLALLTNDYDVLQKDEIVNSFELYTIYDKKLTIDYNPELNKNTLIFLLKPTCKISYRLTCRDCVDYNMIGQVCNDPKNSCVDQNGNCYGWCYIGGTWQWVVSK